jgi:hypothetical protein
MMYISFRYLKGKADFVHSNSISQPFDLGLALKI